MSVFVVGHVGARGRTQNDLPRGSSHHHVAEKSGVLPRGGDVVIRDFHSRMKSDILD